MWWDYLYILSLYWPCDYFSMLRWKLVNVCRWSPTVSACKFGAYNYFAVTEPSDIGSNTLLVHIMCGIYLQIFDVIWIYYDRTLNNLIMPYRICKTKTRRLKQKSKAQLSGSLWRNPPATRGFTHEGSVTRKAFHVPTSLYDECLYFLMNQAVLRKST